MPKSHRMAGLGLDPSHLVPHMLTYLLQRPIPAIEQLWEQPSMRHRGWKQIGGGS